jgi:hypothetical protein
MPLSAPHVVPHTGPPSRPPTERGSRDGTCLGPESLNGAEGPLSAS